MVLDRRKQFEQIYEEYGDAIFRYLYYRVRDRDRALELTQEVFTKFWEYIAVGKAVDHPRAFLYRSAANIFINEIRTDKRTVSLDTLLETGFEVVDDGKTQQQMIEQQEVIERIHDLDDQYKDVLVMRYIEDLQVKEIAKILGQKENTISVWIKRGLEKLKKIYE